MKHSLAKNSFQSKRDWLCTVHEEVCMLCSRVHAVYAFGHAYADGFPYNTTYLFCSVSVFVHLNYVVDFVPVICKIE